MLRGSGLPTLFVHAVTHADAPVVSMQLLDLSPQCNFFCSSGFGLDKLQKPPCHDALKSYCTFPKP